MTRIVNCTHNIENFFPGKYQYYNIPIGKWRRHYDYDGDCGNQDQLWQFLSPYLVFVEESLDSGDFSS